MAAPITPEDLYRFRWIDHVRLSPDGERVAYQISWADAASRQNRSRIVVRKLLDPEAVEPTAGVLRDHSPEWSPDGRSIAFVSKVGAADQLFVLDVTTGGPAQQLSNIPDGVGVPQWSPDGTRIAFLGSVLADPDMVIDDPRAPEGREQLRRAPVARVISLSANLYREPNVTTHQPLLTVPFETNLEVTKAVDPAERWLRIRLPDDRAAWVQRGDVTLDRQPMSKEEIIALSRQFLGVPYLWGGTSSFGFDCSGFTQMLYRRRGIVMPRDASVQAKWPGAAPADRNHLEAGDLLFFGESKVTHTGMYIGDGKFINATTHDRPVVQISNLADPYWTKLFIAARRLK